MESNLPSPKPIRNLLEFCSRGDMKALEQEIRKPGINPNMQDQEGNTPLILAAQAGYTSIVERLLEQFPSINIDQTNNIGQSALMKAAIQGRVTCARTLLRAGADPNKRDYSRGFCALEWAEYVGRRECQHMIAHYMMLPVVKPPRKKTSVVGLGDLQKLTAVATVPLLGDSADSVVPRPRLGSAPIPRLEITVASDQVIRKHSYGFKTGYKQRPHSSMA